MASRMSPAGALDKHNKTIGPAEEATKYKGPYNGKHQ
jgi:hypothetical protein